MKLTTVLRLKCDTKLIRVYDPLHLINKVIMKEQFTQWYVGRVGANLRKGNKETVGLRFSIKKPIHARLIVSAFYRVVLVPASAP